MKYVVSGTVAILIPLAFGEYITQEQLLSADGLYRAILTAGGLGKSEMINGPRLRPDIWP